ncbi:hypothetical protein PSE_2902 [Pseudovibrio sp. FO-BEG1]|nr:hypothetical protein PSE_2902 [Pseudovibrio sp. FO-BEG1]
MSCASVDPVSSNKSATIHFVRNDFTQPMKPLQLTL